MDKSIVYKLLDKWITRNSDRFLSKQWIANCKINGIDPDAQAPGEEEYLKLWSQLSDKVEPYSYRLFSHYMGQTPYVIPETLGYCMLERFLNPRRYQDFYCDKNLFGQVYGEENMPETLIARINGSNLLDKDFLLIDFGASLTTVTAQALADYLFGYDKVCLKPSTDSCSGQGVMLFSREGSIFRSSKGDVLNGVFLDSYADNFVIQRVLRQHTYVSQFNSSSVNTIRLSAYRSVQTEEVIVKGALMRIGAAGSFVDNAHAGGRFIGIDPETGKLHHTTLDQYGTKVNVWNGIDFSEQEFTIPYWEEIIRFAKRVAQRNHQMRLLALDICLTEDGTPKLVEANVGGFSWWLYMYCGQDIFDGGVQHVIDYCKEQHAKQKLHIRMLEK